MHKTNDEIMHFYGLWFHIMKIYVSYNLQIWVFRARALVKVKLVGESHEETYGRKPQHVLNEICWKNKNAENHALSIAIWLYQYIIMK